MKREYMHEQQNTRSTRMIHQQELRTARRLELLSKLRTNTVATHSSLPNYETIKNGILSLDLRTVYQSVFQFRQFLCQSNAPPIQEVIKTHLVPRFVELISQNNILYSDTTEKELINSCRIESAWVLTNIASGNTTQTSTIIENGGIPLLFKMIREEDEVADQAIWCLGNIAGDKEIFRDNILHFPNSLSLLSDLFKRNNLVLTRNVTWLLSNLCRGKNPSIEKKDAAFILELFVNLLQNNDPEVKSDVFWGISYIIDGNVQVITSEVIAMLYSMLTQCNSDERTENAPPKTCISPLVRCLGNGCVMSDDILSFLVSHSFLQVLKDIFYKNSSNKLRKEICWILSNVSLSYDIKEVYDVLFYALESCEKNTKAEALYALMNLEDETIYSKILGYMVEMANYDDALNEEIIKCVERSCAKGGLFVSLTLESKILEFISGERSELVKLRFNL